jgi:hypothetical protein
MLLRLCTVRAQEDRRAPGCGMLPGMPPSPSRTPTDESAERARRARRRALRAAQVVAVSGALLGCGAGAASTAPATTVTESSTTTTPQETAPPETTPSTPGGDESANNEACKSPDQSRECCERERRTMWLEDESRCITRPMPVVGPRVPPAYVA